VVQLQFLREWKLSDRRLYEVFERRLLIWGNPKERNRRQIQRQAFFLRHPVPLLCVQWKTPDDGQRNCPKHVEFYSKNKFEKLVYLGGFIIRILAINFSLLVWILLHYHCRCRALLLGITISDRHTFSKTPLGERSASGRDLYRTTRTHILPQQTDIHGPGEVGTHNPSRWVAADPRPRPRGQRDNNLYRSIKS